MMTKILAASLAALAFATTPVFAQSSTSPSMPGSSAGHAGQLSFLQAPQGNQVLASELMDADVYGADGNSIGEISDILLDRGGQVHAVVFGVGGFLGMGEKNVAVPYNTLQIAPAPASSTAPAPSATNRRDWSDQYRITLSVTRDQLRNAPAFNSQRATTTGQLSVPSGTAR